MPPLRRKNTKFSRKAKRFATTNRRTRKLADAAARRYVSGNFARGYDRVGGLYKLHGPTRRGGELKYCDKSLGLDTVTAGANSLLRDDAATMIWSDDVGAVVAVAMATNKWYIGQSVVNLAQGQGPSNRIGRKTTLRNISAKLGISAATIVDATAMNWCARVLWIHDRQCNGGIVTAADIFEPVAKGAAGFNSGGNLSIAALPNMGNSQRFTVIRDDTFPLTKNWGNAVVDAGATTYQGIYNAMKEYFIPANLEIEQVGDGAQISGIKSSNVIVAIQIASWSGNRAETGAENSGTMTLWGNVRTRYDDN